MMVPMARHLDFRTRNAREPLTISCDDCSMQCSSHCDDCMVSFLVRDEGEPRAARFTPLVLDGQQAEVLRLLAKAGLVPELRYELAG
jgi:hypothetical protein